MAVKHSKVSAVSDGGDTSLVRPSDWNADHTIASNTVTEDQLSIADNTTKNASTSMHGFLPKLPGGTTDFLRADGTFAAPGGGVSDYVSGASGSGHIVIPGIAASPDIVPGSPSAYDDEFDATDTTDPITGWTTLQTLDALNSNSDAKSHLHMAKTATGTFELYGVYKAIPSMPFTVTAKLSDAIIRTNYARAGIMLLEGTPGKIMEFGLHITAAGVSNLGRGIWTDKNTRASFTDNNVPVIYPPIYLRMVVTSSTSVATYYSEGGFEFSLIASAINPGFTIGNVGLYITGEDNSVAAGAWFDWIRFT